MEITRKQKGEEKRLYGRFKRLTRKISRMGKIKRETESLLIAAQNNAIRTDHIKVKIDKTQQNSRCELFGDRDETTNHIINKCSKLAQKEYKNRYDWLGKVIHLELCKKFEFDHTNKRYMHNPECFQENVTHKLLWDIKVVIIMSRRLRGYPWPSLATSPYHSSPPAGLQDYNPCPHIAAVCKFVLVVPLLHIHEWGSTGVHRLWARPCFSSSVLRVWFVELV